MSKVWKTNPPCLNDGDLNPRRLFLPQKAKDTPWDADLTGSVACTVDAKKMVFRRICDLFPKILLFPVVEETEFVDWNLRIGFDQI